MTTPDPYYITTPIYYVNDRPHIGHCYTTILADIAARFERLRRGVGQWAVGNGAPDRAASSPLPTPHSPRPSVFFLTGTDEHADKVVTSAAAHNTTPQEWADRNAAEFKKAFAFVGSTHDDFIRTTEPRHKDKVTQYVAALQKSGAIYKGEYTGWYDENQEEYVTETAAKENDFKGAISRKPLVKRTEPCYFFRLSRYQPRLIELLTTHPEFVRPDARRNEVLGRLRPPAALNDVPVSRPVTNDPATQWGIRVPGDDAHRVYVWIDALFNYLTVVDTPERRPLWSASVHLIGKDILWFHAVIWPALLMALKESGPEYAWVDLPRTVFGHGWWISEGQKMSKSLGNFIDLEKLQAYAGRYSLDAVRWYLATQGPMSGSDADFSHAKFVEVYNADLANGIGNCASRVGNMIDKYFDGKVPDPKGITENAGINWPAITGAFVDRSCAAMGTLDLAGALGAATELVRAVDGYINVTAPFKLAKTVDADTTGKAKDQLGVILYHCAEAVRVATLLFAPAMPQKIAQLWKTWNCEPSPGVPLGELAAFGGPHALKPGRSLTKGEALFMRADPAEALPGAS